MQDVANPIIIDQFYCDSPIECKNQVWPKIHFYFIVELVIPWATLVVSRTPGSHMDSDKSGSWWSASGLILQSIKDHNKLFFRSKAQWPHAGIWDTWPLWNPMFENQNKLLNDFCVTCFISQCNVSLHNYPITLHCILANYESFA